MDHVVKLEALPDGLTFPPDFLDRIRYDPSSRRLIFRGFMSKTEFDRLCELSGNWSYRRALEDLFRLCVPEPPPRHRGLRAVLNSLTSLWIT